MTACAHPLRRATLASARTRITTTSKPRAPSPGSRSIWSPTCRPAPLTWRLFCTGLF